MIPTTFEAFVPAFGSGLFSLLIWLVKALFFGGWMLARWLTWLSWPIWASIIAIGALCGFLKS